MFEKSARWAEIVLVLFSFLYGIEGFAKEYRAPASIVSTPRLVSPISQEPAWHRNPLAAEAAAQSAASEGAGSPIVKPAPWRLMPSRTLGSTPTPAWTRIFRLQD